MNSILVIDDEKIIADGLVSIIKARIPFDIEVQAAYSASSALEIHNSKDIDLIISDINMPGFNGFEMAKIMASDKPETHIMFLTAYERFDYAYEAFRQNNTTFMLKTESYDKIIETITDILTKINNEKNKKKYMDEVQEQIKEHMGMIKKNFVSGLITEKFNADESIITKCFYQFDIPFSYNEKFQLVVGRWDENETNDYYDTIANSQAVETITDKLLEKNTFVYTNIDDQYHIWIIKPASRFELSEVFERIQTDIIEICNKTMSFLCDTEMTGWEDVGERTKKLKNILSCFSKQCAIVTDKFKVFDYSENFEMMSMSSDSKLYKLNQFLENGNREKYFEILDDILTPLKQCKQNNFAAIGLYFSVSSIIINYIISHQLLQKFAFDRDFHVFELTSKYLEYTWPETIDYITELSAAIFELKDQITEDNVNKTIKSIKEYINKNIFSPTFSVTEISKNVFLSPCYLSTLFKEKTGMLLNDYINHIKIENAKKMLENPEYKICDISEKLGYGTQSSFGRFFKAMTGMSAKSYREKYMR